MTAHAKYVPSSAARIVACPASARMEAMYPQEETIATREGDAMHWAGAELLNGNEVAEGQVAPNGVVLNVEMVEAAEMWAHHITSRGPVGNVEKTITDPALHPDNWGTPDHWVYIAAEMTLYLDDLKGGHRFVNVYLCWQLINYAALILRSLGLYGDDRIRIVCTLVLPRCFAAKGPIQTWITTLGEINPYLKRLSAAFRAADDPNALCDASDVEQCSDCSARFDCPANLEAAGIAVHVTSQAIPLHMAPAAKAKLLRVLSSAEERIKSMREGVQQDLTMTLKRRHAVPHFMLEARPGREVFADDAVQNGIIEVAAEFGVDVVKKQELITPKQAIKAGVPASIVRMYSKTNSGALVLVEDDGSTAARIFTQQ